MAVELPTRPLVLEHILINPFMTDPQPLLLFQAARDLLRAPLLPQQSRHRGPSSARDSGLAFGSALQRQCLCLLRSITAFPAIAFQFAAHAGFIHSQHVCNLRKIVPHFLKCINLVSLFPGKLVVGPHGAPLTWSLENALSYSSLPLPSTFKVALTS